MLLAIMSIGISVIWAVGYPALQGAQSHSSIQRVQQAFASLDSKLSKATLGEAPSQAIFMQLGTPSAGGFAGGGALSVNNSSWMLVNLTDEDGDFLDCINVTLGALVFEMENQTVAYEGGGVWFADSTGGQIVVTPPEFHYDGTTLTLPIVNISGASGASGAGTATISVNSSNLPVVHYATGSGINCATGASVKRENPMSGGRINVTVHSNYYRAWGTYMETLTGTTITYDDANNNVSARFSPPVTTTPFEQAIYAADELDVKSSARVNSYDSTTETCESAYSAPHNGDVKAASEITVDSNGLINGSANSSGKIDLKSNAQVTGTCRGSPIKLGNGASCGSQSGAVKLNTLASVDGEINSKISSFSSSNDNVDSTKDASNCIPDSGGGANQIDNPSGSTTCRFHGPAKFYLTKLKTVNDDLLFHTFDGIIDVALASSSQFQIDGDVKVFGDNPVRFWLGSGVEPDIKTGAKILVNPNSDEDENSTAAYRNTSLMQFWLYSGGSSFTLKNSVNFTAVVYSPQKDVSIDNAARVCGALIGKEVEVKSSQVMNWDENLKNVQLFSADSAIVQYLHISENRLNVTIS